MVSPQGAHLSRPAGTQAQYALRGAILDFLTRGGFQDNGLDTEEWLHGRPRLECVRPWQRGQQVTTGFSLPPGIDDRAVTAPDDLVIPVPGLGIDRLANSAEHPEATEVAGFYERLALSHQCAYRGRCGVELVDAVLLADLPESAGVGVGGDALEHECGSAVSQRTVHNVAMSGYPAHVGGAPVDITGVVVKHQFMGQRGVYQVASGAMHHALGLAGGARGVENEQRIFGIHFLGRAFRARCGGKGVIVVIPFGIPGDFAAGAAHHQQGGAGRAGFKRFIRIGLEGSIAATAGGLVGGDHQFCL